GPKSEREYLSRSRPAKLCIRALAALRANSRWGTSEHRTSLTFRNLETRPNLRTDQHDATTCWARRKYQLALSIAARASLVAKLPAWRVYLHCAMCPARPMLRFVVHPLGCPRFGILIILSHPPKIK